MMGMAEPVVAEFRTMWSIPIAAEMDDLGLRHLTKRKVTYFVYLGRGAD